LLRNFTKTSIIDLSIEVPEAQVYLDGKLLEGEPPLENFQCFSRASISWRWLKKAFLPWKYEVDVQADFVSSAAKSFGFPGLGSKVEWEKGMDDGLRH
jgi:hypothetical protein